MNDALDKLEPRHDTLIAIDSDGCVFDTVAVKQMDHLMPLAIEYLGLEAIRQQFLQVAEFVNLHSYWRGSNRFRGLLKTLLLLKEYPGIEQSGAELPDLTPLEDYVDSGAALGNPTLEKEVERTGSPLLERLLAWSKAVNTDIESNMRDVPPYPGVREGLDKMAQTSDLVVLSQSPHDTLMQEWSRHGVIEYVRVIAGQEVGSKQDQLALAVGTRYEPGKVLMVGDALGDRKAAAALDACFYPIRPGEETASWERLHDEAYDLFLQGRYRGAYEDALIAAYEYLLPKTPPWRK
jgi:phosphoglycolate phosphatase-like HAD superfamily hydrolase